MTWDELKDEPASKRQRRAVYRLGIIRREVIAELTRDEASDAIDFCLRLLGLDKGEEKNVDE